MKAIVVALTLCVLGLGGLVICQQGADSANAETRAFDFINFPPKVGTPCTVHFRRDALGLFDDQAISPDVSSIQGNEVTIRGRFCQMDSSWVVLTSENNYEEVWVPRDMILLFKVSKFQRQYPQP